ncbi:MAG: protein kinase domain-containing protein [Gemmatimonadales bacterium]
MICPRCSVGEISEQSHECLLCGFSPGAEAGVRSVMIETPVHSDPDAGVRHALARQFHVESALHRSPLSAVYLARDVETDALVALKIIPRLPFLDASLPERFQREAALAALLDHPHIVPVLRYGTSDTLVWCSMELSNGRSLAEVARSTEGKPLDLRSCLRIVQQVASALDYAHRRGVAHGNVKASNILVDEGGWAQLMDFGMVRAVGGVGALQAVEWPAGALDYLAPDYFAPRSLVGPSSDQYALGVLVYECLSGQPPLGAMSVDELAQHHRTALPPSLSALRPDVPPHVADAVARAMGKLPQTRFANILDFAAVLSGPAAPASLSAPPPPATPPGAKPAPQRSDASHPAPGTNRASPSGPTAPRPSPVPKGKASAPVLYVEGGGEPDPSLPALPPKRKWRVLVAVAAPLLTILLGATWWLITTPAPDPAPVQWERLEPLPPAPTGGTPGSSVARPQPASPGGPSSQPVRPPAAVPRPTVPGPAQAPAPRPAATRAAPPGFVVVNATPWAELYVDGRLVGNTPMVNLELPPGTHQLRLVRDGFEPYERLVLVTSGQTLRITDLVLQEIKP